MVSVHGIPHWNCIRSGGQSIVRHGRVRLVENARGKAERSSLSVKLLLGNQPSLLYVCASGVYLFVHLTSYTPVLPLRLYRIPVSVAS